MKNNWPKKIGEFDFNGMKIKAYQSIYDNGRPAIFLKEGGFLFAKISINLIDDDFKDGEFPVKNWMENEKITPYFLQHTDLFEDTGKLVPTGRVQAPIWRFKKKKVCQT